MLKINQQTRISTIIKENKASIAAIAAIAVPFQKLKNPILRHLIAPRVTVADAASIGGCTIEDFRLALEPLGFVFEKVCAGENMVGSLVEGVYSDVVPKQRGEKEPEWFSSLRDSTVDRFDVRQHIARGDDPLKSILQRYRALPNEHALCIINTFIPYPLLLVLERQGASNYVQSKAVDLHYTWFFKAAIPDMLGHSSTNSQICMLGRESFELLLAEYLSEQILVVDVRALPMPEPMERLLEHLLILKEGQVLHVYHKRMPLHLLEELEHSGFAVRICEYNTDDIRLIIYHDSR
ncbi:Uncharacterized conserved protein [Sphingobacterium psychroaquaticum]|uniref:Uncharacterized conserved protein n=2 Tax=Sphingobacterium psychroaquaticum TaxID=561061 RepID=A0A1X7INQ3_9SPHI|nr:Uncharacterized conserved protein [Sphingobacterium psychroaquaticum]